MSRRRIASVSTLSIAVTAFTLGISSVASAQRPPVDTPEAHSPEYRGSDVNKRPTVIPDDDTPLPYQSTQPPIQTTEPPAQTTTTSTTQTTSAEYQENVGTERTESHVGTKVAISGTGAVLLLGPYVAGVIVAAESPLEQDHRLYIPVVGPWLDLGQRPGTFGGDSTTGDKVGSVLLIGSGVAQAAGLVMLVSGLAVPSTTRTTTTTTATVEKPHVAVTPLSFQGGGGLGAVGTF